MIALLVICVALLAYANGANDNFKGVASLYGSRICSYRTALGWATIATLVGSIAAIFLATALLKNFSGKGLVSGAITQSPAFLLSVACGAAVTVLLANRFGFPISTTHALVGALLGGGISAGAGQVNFAMLGGIFVAPLLVSPLLAMITGGIGYLLLKGLRIASGIREETCVCIGNEWVPIPSNCDTTCATNALTLTVDSTQSCERRYLGNFLGIDAKTLIDTLHFLSAGAVSFARGLNDTPKIAALLLITGAWVSSSGLLLVALAVAIGGILSARRVARTMSEDLTEMNPGQGFAANLSTALLVTTASIHGLPVSTTHVSVGALLGMGTVTGQAKWQTVIPVLASWVITLPIAAALSAASYTMLTKFSS